MAIILFTKWSFLIYTSLSLSVAGMALLSQPHRASASALLTEGRVLTGQRWAFVTWASLTVTQNKTAARLSIKLKDNTDEAGMEVGEGERQGDVGEGEQVHLRAKFIWMFEALSWTTVLIEM